MLLPIFKFLDDNRKQVTEIFCRGRMRKVVYVKNQDEKGMHISRNTSGNSSQHADGWGDRRAYGAGPVCQEDPVASLAAGRRIYICRGRGLQRRLAPVTTVQTPGFGVTPGLKNFAREL